MTDPTNGELAEALERLEPVFGDVVENGWASERNPTRRGFFVRAFIRKGRMNPGLTWEITDGKGKFWELKPDERVAVTPAYRLRSGLTREGVARTLYERHPAVRFEKDPRGGAPLNRAATWDEATEDEKADDYAAADAILALTGQGSSVAESQRKSEEG